MTHSLISFAVDFYNGKYQKSAYDFAVEFIHRRYQSKEPEVGLEGEVIGSIFLDCDRFEPDADGNPQKYPYEINEIQFREELKKHLKQLKVI